MSKDSWKIEDLMRNVIDKHYKLDDKLAVYIYNKKEGVYERAVIVASGSEIKGQVDLFCEKIKQPTIASRLFKKGNNNE